MIFGIFFHYTESAIDTVETLLVTHLEELEYLDLDLDLDRDRELLELDLYLNLDLDLDLDLDLEDQLLIELTELLL